MWFRGNTDLFCRHKVVVVEGNYLLLDEGVWEDMSSYFDEKWYDFSSTAFQAPYEIMHALSLN